MYRYLGELYSLAIKAHPSLAPLYGRDGMVMTKAIAEMQEALTQAGNREVPLSLRALIPTPSLCR